MFQESLTPVETQTYRQLLEKLSSETVKPLTAVELKQAPGLLKALLREEADNEDVATAVKLLSRMSIQAPETTSTLLSDQLLPASTLEEGSPIVNNVEELSGSILNSQQLQRLASYIKASPDSDRAQQFVRIIAAVGGNEAHAVLLDLRSQKNIVEELGSDIDFRLLSDFGDAEQVGRMIEEGPSSELIESLVSGRFKSLLPRYRSAIEQSIQKTDVTMVLAFPPLGREFADLVLQKCASSVNTIAINPESGGGSAEQTLYQASKHGTWASSMAIESLLKKEVTQGLALTAVVRGLMDNRNGGDQVLDNLLENGIVDPLRAVQLIQAMSSVGPRGTFSAQKIEALALRVVDQIDETKRPADRLRVIEALLDNVSDNGMSRLVQIYDSSNSEFTKAGIISYLEHLQSPGSTAALSTILAKSSPTDLLIAIPAALTLFERGNASGLELLRARANEAIKVAKEGVIPMIQDIESAYALKALNNALTDTDMLALQRMVDRAPPQYRTPRMIRLLGRGGFDELANRMSTQSARPHGASAELLRNSPPDAVAREFQNLLSSNRLIDSETVAMALKQCGEPILPSVFQAVSSGRIALDRQSIEIISSMGVKSDVLLNAISSGLKAGFGQNKTDDMVRYMVERPLGSLFLVACMVGSDKARTEIHAEYSENPDFKLLFMENLNKARQDPNMTPDNKAFLDAYADTLERMDKQGEIAPFLLSPLVLMRLNARVPLSSTAPVFNLSFSAVEQSWQSPARRVDWTNESAIAGVLSAADSASRSGAGVELSRNSTKEDFLQSIEIFCERAVASKSSVPPVLVLQVFGGAGRAIGVRANTIDPQHLVYPEDLQKLAPALATLPPNATIIFDVTDRGISLLEGGAFSKLKSLVPQANRNRVIAPAGAATVKRITLPTGNVKTTEVVYGGIGESSLERRVF